MEFNLDQYDQTFQDVKDFENHPICLELGWDLGILRSLIDSSFMGGRFNRKERAYITTERYLIIAAIERSSVIRNRLAAEERLAGLRGPEKQ